MSLTELEANREKIRRRIWLVIKVIGFIDGLLIGHIIFLACHG
jgi:hypothetical protein